ncbi:YceI family protein [Campylobacter sp. 19-13652]|uniref:YceI family protein n=1 Tax=Campylobacter sp. 19-13652 TaxID=2840180 RepID=UPI001C797F41|nr:YceI family protein [Campylobacter sp. 19-13652]BCX79627.1 polyisoprenoid-binding protein [Campylobacter sp. 19-13652]
MKKIIYSTLAALALSSSLSADTFILDKAHSNVAFKIKHMGLSNVNGFFKDYSALIDFDVKENKFNALKADIKVASVDTDNSKRDEHLRTADFFNVDKYPDMTFEMTNYKADGDDGKMVGVLTIAGVSKEVKLDTDINGHLQKDGKTIVGFSLSGKIKRSDFDFAQGFGSSLIGDEIKISIDGEMSADE